MTPALACGPARFLQILCVMFLIAGFTATPIAAAEYTQDTEYDVKLNDGKTTLSTSITLRDLHDNLYLQSSSPVACNSDENTVVDVMHDDMVTYVADHPSLSVTANGKTLGAEEIDQLLVDHPNAHATCTMEKMKYSTIKIVCDDCQNMTVELSEWITKQSEQSGALVHEKVYAIYQCTTNGTVIFNVPTDGHQYNHIHAVNYVDESGTFTSMCREGASSYSSDITMPDAGQTFTISMSIYAAEDFWSSIAPLAAFVMISVAALVLVALMTWGTMACMAAYAIAEEASFEVFSIATSIALAA